ncbi:MAG: cell wall hydrolase [Clostridia bacterium]|nr:cell wall hydrolase [Clostridia bacterium]
MRFKALLLMTLMVIVISSAAFATDSLLSINGQIINNDDMTVVDSGVVYGSVSMFAVRLGIDVTWLDLSKLAVVYKDGNYVSFGMETNKVLVNNEYATMDHSTRTKDGRIYVPMDYLSELFGFAYLWDENELTTKVSHPLMTVSADEIVNLGSYTDEDLMWLARIVDIEARDGSVVKKTAVANVVLNRVADPRFPNTIREVIFQRGQFPPAYYSSFSTLQPRETSFIAARRAMLGIQVAKDCLYFNMVPFKSKAEDFYKNIEGDYFYY